MQYDELLKTALKGADIGAKITKKYFGKLKHIGKKPDAGLVTIADKESEAAIIKTILSKFPDHQIYAEESGEKKTSSNVRWIIDPLDGTTNYAHQMPHFCVSIAVEVGGKVVLGVLDAPILGERFIAVKGRGATLNKKKINVSGIATIEDSLLATGFSYKYGDIVNREVERLKHVFKKVRSVRRLGSAALDMAYVACGRFDGFWETDLAAWDIAAGAIIVEEAGGRLTNFNGDRFNCYEGELIATNTLLHNDLKELISLKGAANL